MVETGDIGGHSMVTSNRLSGAVDCKICGNLVPRTALVCLKCGIWTRTGPTGFYVLGALKAVAAVATGVALPLVLLIASRKFDDRTAQTSRADRLQGEQASAVGKAAADARDATSFSIEVFEIQRPTTCVRVSSSARTVPTLKSADVTSATSRAPVGEPALELGDQVLAEQRDTRRQMLEWWCDHVERAAADRVRRQHPYQRARCVLRLRQQLRQQGQANPRPHQTVDERHVVGDHRARDGDLLWSARAAQAPGEQPG
jgi:hypothetical protein